MTKAFIYKEETYQIIGLCMEIHSILSRGLLEIVYKDALEYELRQNNIPYIREKQHDIEYKDIILPHKFYADFVVYENLILEIKASNGVVDDFVKQTLNNMGISKSPVVMIINFGEESLKYKRLVL
jgi:GxxExxY protein